MPSLGKGFFKLFMQIFCNSKGQLWMMFDYHPMLQSIYDDKVGLERKKIAKPVSKVQGFI